VDRATHPGHKVGADLHIWDAVEHWFTLPGSLGVKWSQVQILSARRLKPALTSVGEGFVVLGLTAGVR
jgi:hypothetical protein